MGVGLIPTDDSGKVTLALVNDATGLIVPLHAKSTVVGADNKTYAVLDTGAASANDTFGTATNITAATTFSGIPTISQLAANSYALLANPGDQATFLVAILVASAFVGTLSFYGLEPDGVTLQLINAHQRNSTANSNSTAISTASVLNQVWMGNIAAWKTMYVVCTAFTSGSASVQLGLSAAPYSVAILNTASVQDIETAGYIALVSPPANTNAGSDTPLTFSSQVNRVVMQNNSAATAYFDFDQAASTASPVLTPGSFLVYPKKCTSPHLYTVAATPINAASGILVRGAL